MDDVPERVSEDLHFDVTSMRDKPFDVDSSVTEGLLRFATGSFEGADQFEFVLSSNHPPATPAGGRFQEDREPDPIRDCDRRRHVSDSSGGLTLPGSRVRQRECERGSCRHLFRSPQN